MTNQTNNARRTRQPAKGRSAISNDPLRSSFANGRTAGSRRYKDLARAMLAEIPGPHTDAVQFKVRRASELSLVAEAMRRLWLSGRCNIGDLLAAEGLAERAVRAA